MRVLEKIAYRFDELSEKAQEKAYTDYVTSSHFEYFWIDESIDSLKAFCKAFNVPLKDWALTTYGHSFIDTEAENKHFRGLKLKDAEYLMNRADTGYCVFDHMMHEFKEFYAISHDMKASFNHAIDKGLTDTIKDMEYQESMEYFKEHSEINQWEYDEDGNFI